MNLPDSNLNSNNSGKNLIPRQKVEALYPDIFPLVRLALYLHRYHAPDVVIEDLSHDIVVLLIEDDFRRLRTFDESKASIKTWLKAVVMRHVGRHISRLTATQSLNEISEDDLYYDGQDEMLSEQEYRRTEMQTALSRLTRRERQLFDLLCQDGMSVEDIADQMGVQVSSVYKRKHVLTRKLRVLVKKK